MAIITGIIIGVSTLVLAALSMASVWLIVASYYKIKKLRQTKGY
jgi:hypothetical protein